MNEVREWLVKKVLVPIYKARSSDDLRTWMEKNIVLRPTESPERAGPYRGDDAVPVTKLMWEFERGPWRELAVQKCSQSGLTMHTLALLTRRADENPVNAIYALDSATEVRNISRRLRAMLEDCPLTREKARRCAESDDMTNLQFRLPGMNLWFVGAGSAGQLANKTAGIGVVDEVDKHKVPAGEAPTIELMRGRLKTIEGGKLIIFSTPTTEEGAIHQEYLHGSRHKYHVPCPHCGEGFAIEWKDFKFGHCRDLAGFWDLDRVRTETYVECPHCGAAISEEHKRGMVAGGVWKPTNFREFEEGEELFGEEIPAWSPGCLSAHLPDWYSFHETTRWGALAVKFVTALDKPGALHAFYNDHAGEPFKHAAAQIGENQILDLRGDYERGTLPVVPAVVCLAVDVQGDVQKWVKLGFEKNGTMWVADWGETLSLEELLDVADDPLPCGPAGERRLKVQRAMIDEGYRSLDIRRFCYALFPRFFPGKGRGGIQVRHVTDTKEHRIDMGGLRTIPVLHYSDDDFKRELYITLIKNHDAHKAEAYGRARIWLPRNVTEGFVRELMGERLEKVKGQWKWIQSPPNDFGDCLKMGRVIWSTIAEAFQPRAQAIRRVESAADATVSR